jgi:hypothetical protein
MNPTSIESIANAVLYEGYMLYPYRPSAVKNRQRWNFGVIYPQAYSQTQKGIDPWFMQTQCLVRGGESGTVHIKVRFLQAISRQMGKLAGPAIDAGNSGPNVEIVHSLQVGGKVLQSWQEAVERDVILPPAKLTNLLGAPIRHDFAFSGTREFESVNGDEGSIAAYIVRTREAITGSVEIGAVKCGDGLFKITVLISNPTPVEAGDRLSREEVLLKSLLSAHTVLSATGGEFISLIDPPARLRGVVADCKNIGTWPVLAGDETSKNAMLSSPIILYDYPQIAPESPGDLFDGTEIDEILALRILTLSDGEKHEIRHTDARVGEILDRTETMPAEHFLKLHGVLRGLKPVAEFGGDNAPDLAPKDEP